MTATRWTWLSSQPNGALAALAALESPDAVDHGKAATPSDIPVAIRCVVLVMELALASGGAFLLMLTSSTIGALVRSVVQAVDSDNLDGVDQISEAAAFVWGVVTFMSWFFRQSKRGLLVRLTRFGWSSVTSCTMSMALHSVAVIMVTLVQRQTEDQVVVSWRYAETAVHLPDGSLATVKMMQNLLLAPIKEEFFFRGVIVLVAINRLQSVKWSASISSFLFAAIHLINARHLGTQYSVSYVTFQVLWALLVGFFLALRLAVSGSLVECLVLHIINNIFALGVSKTSTMDLKQPVVGVSVLIALIIYSVAIARLLQRLQCSTKAGSKNM